MTVTEFLRDHVPFLSGIEQAHAHELAACADQVQVAAGQMVVMQGETLDSVHVVATGKLSVVRKDKGKPGVLLAELGSGAVFGEASILEFGVAGATIRAVEDSLVFRIPQAAFLKVMADNAALKTAVLAKIAARKPPKKNGPQS